MKINGNPIKLAQQFLNILKRRLKNVPSKENIILETYANGREHGYHLCVLGVMGLSLIPEKNSLSRWGCSFSENRNSDQLVIYIARGFSQFNFSNVPQDSAYADKRFFSWDAAQFNLAADYVAESLMKFLTEVQSYKDAQIVGREMAASDEERLGKP